MSGIAGLYADHAADRALLEAMIGRLGHRGGGARAVHVEGRAGLALAQRDGAPLGTPDGRYVLVADGAPRIDGALPGGSGGAAGLAPEWCAALATCDGRIDDIATRIDGPFALALLDHASGRLLLARDAIGTRPLCLARTVYGWAFASEPKGLLPAIGTPAIDPEALARYLQCGYAAGRRTLFAGVERVGPGGFVIIDGQGHAAHRRHWTAPMSRLRIDDGEAAARLGQAMDGIAAAFGGAGETVLLHDGVEAALLLAYLRRGGATPTRLVSLGSAAAGGALLAEHFSVPHDAIPAPAKSLARHLAPATWAADELVAEPGLPAPLLLPMTERTTLIGGATGAAIAFAGDPVYDAGLLQRWFDRLVEPDAGGFRARGAFSGHERAFFNLTLQRATQEWRAPFVEAWQACPDANDLQRMQHVDLRTLAPDRLLPALDRPAMASGLDWRAPWLDRRVVELGLALPDRLKRGGPDRFLQRRAAELLPRTYLDAMQASRRPGWTPWLAGATLDRLEPVLAASPALRAWFQPGTVASLVRRARTDRAARRRLALLLQFALWHRIFIESDGDRPPGCDPLEYLGS